MEMGMYKEFIICTVVIVFIVILNIATESYTKASIDTINENLENLKEIIREEESDEIIKKQIDEISEDWEKRYQKLAYYIEHDELEKVETELVSLKANIEINEYEQGIPDLDKCIFILKHIKEKSSIQIKNIF